MPLIGLVMNPYGAIILGGLLLEFGLGMLTDILNLRALDIELPHEFRDVLDPERYRRAQAYTRLRTRFGGIASACTFATLVGFWFFGGFAELDSAARGFGLGAVGTGLLFVGALGLALSALRVPFRLFATFVIEERFGFNKTSWWTFCTDLVKGLLLAAMIGGPLLAAILWLFEQGGERAWLWCWLAAALSIGLLQFVAPTWILPLFHRFTPLGDGPLRDHILAYARSVGFPLEGVFVVDGSRRSTKANAFFTGVGRRKRVALFDTLIEKLDTAEMVAVVAHEVGHYRRRHVVIGMVLAILHTGAMLFLLSLFLERPGLFDAFYVEEPSVHAGLVFVALLLTPVELVLSIALQALSRRHEYEADRFAAETTGSGAALARGLKRLSADSLANLNPHPLHVVLHHSHPPVLERIRALRIPA